MIDSLCDQAGEKNATVACFYFDFADQRDQSPASTMGALLKQVVGGLEEILEGISQAFQKQKKAIGGRGPRLSDIVEMLQTTSYKGRTFICIDALDECVPEHRAKLLYSLAQILKKSPGTRIFVTGRPHIRPEIRRHLTGRVTSLPISTKRDDIIRYLHSRLQDDTTPDAMDSRLEADILKKIPEDVSEMYVKTATLLKLPQAFTNKFTFRFLLVSLNIDAILEETTIHRRRQKLSVMSDGTGLGDAYGATLSRIKRQGGEKARLGMAALMWISHAERPLKASELCHALAVEIGSSNLKTDNVPSTNTLLACCQGLVVVEKEASTVRLIHFTLQEYLRAHPALFGAAHSTIAETCLTYLNSHQFKAVSTTPSPDLQDTPFLEYSSGYWGVHAKRDLSDCAKQLVLKLFDDFSHHASTKVLMRTQTMLSFDVDRFSGFSGLHCASFFGIVEIVAVLVQMEGCDINQIDSQHNTPLMWAARNGHEGVVKILLRRDGANPNKPDNNGKTPLWCAAYNGDEGVVKMLLERDDVNPDKPDNDGKTPLWWAAYYGYGGVVNMLLKRDDVNPDKPDNDGQTPLGRAAYNGHEGVVKMLLERDDVSPDQPNNDGRTPLWCAAYYGYGGVVNMLLERDDVNPDKPDNDGQTPLWYAARKEHEGVVKMLLERDDVNPDQPNNYSQTPLWCAAYYGYGGVVNILLERDDVNPDKPDNNGQTPLWCAAHNGHEGVVKILLGRDGVNPDKPDNDGRTSLLCAVYNGHEGVVKMLLRSDEVNPDKPDNDGRTSLLCAAYNGHEGVVKILLGRDDVNPDKPDNSGQTPLYLAASRGHKGVLKMLLSRDDVSPDQPNNYGQTPLLIAAFYGHKGVVEILLGRDDVNPDKPNINSRTALYSAAWNGHKGVVKMLLLRDDVNPHRSDKDGKTPLDRATERGHQEVVALLQPPEPAAPSLS